MLWVVFTRKNNLLSRAIRSVTSGSHSHALLLWEDKSLGWLRMEAGWDGYHIRPAPHGPNLLPQAIERVIESHDSVAIPLSNTHDGVLTHCAKRLGSPYDYLGLVGFMVVSLGRLLKKKWRNPLSSPSALFCSEAIAEALKARGYKGFEDVDPSTISPHDLLVILSQQRQLAWTLDDAT